MQRYLTIALALGCLHCTAEEAEVAFDAPETVVDCLDKDDHDIPKTTATLVRLEASTSGTALLVFGTATPPRQLAIRSLSVAGVDAVSDSFNYRNWSATIPESAFTVKNDEITLLVSGSDACQGFSELLEGAAPDAFLPKPPAGGAGSE